MPHSGRLHLVRRRTLALLVAALVLVVPAGVLTGVPPVAAAAPDPGGSAGVVLTDVGDGVGAADVPLDDGSVARAAGGYRSRVVRSDGFTLLGLTWDSGERRTWARVRTGGAWSSWRRLALLADGPDQGSGEGNGRAGTDLLWVGDGPDPTAAQVRVAGPRPAGLTLTLIDSHRARETSVRALAGGAQHRHPLRPRPVLRSRGVWGADESLRSGSPTYNRTIQQVHVHHTVNSNDYARSDVPGLLRGIYRYHTQNLGWSDIGYNFLVDRFGRIWVGRAGGPKRAVRGAHTLSFNSTSTGVAVIGNFETADPGHRVITALVQLAAWKLHRAGRDPAGRVWVYSHGSDRFASGRTLKLPTIDGHRDTNETACPGGRLYRHLPVIRERAAEREKRFGRN